MPVYTLSTDQLGVHASGDYAIMIEGPMEAPGDPAAGGGDGEYAEAGSEIFMGITRCAGLVIHIGVNQSCNSDPYNGSTTHILKLTLIQKLSPWESVCTLSTDPLCACFGDYAIMIEGPMVIRMLLPGGGSASWRV